MLGTIKEGIQGQDRIESQNPRYFTVAEQIQAQKSEPSSSLETNLKSI